MSQTHTFVGNITATPEIRFTANGVAVASFTVAVNDRIYDRSTGEWKDGEPFFLRCSAWRQLGENVVESLDKGARVVVTGKLRQRSYETKEGEKRTVVELDADEVAASLKYATARVSKVSRSGDSAPVSVGASAGSDPFTVDEAPF